LTTPNKRFTFGENASLKFNHIKAFAFDVDGVFSDMLMLHPSGELMRTMNVKDDYTVQYACRKGYPVAIITGGNIHLTMIRIMLNRCKK